MSPKVITGIKNFITRRLPELTQLRISWFGGEPLAAYPIVLDISQYAKSLMDEKGCQYNFGMTTNAYLLDSAKFALFLPCFPLKMSNSAMIPPVLRAYYTKNF